MDHHAIPQQVLVEHQTLAFILSALRSTIGWKYQGADLTRKLASLQFVGLSFQRHMKHLMALEEEGGYMAVVLASRPELSEEVEMLRQEHEVFRKGITRVLSRLKRVEPTDHVAFAAVSEEMLALLARLDGHSRRETDLLQEALLTDSGGEG